MGLESIINLSISRNTAAVTQAGFGTPLIMGSNAAFSGVRSYSSLTDVVADFASSTDEYKAAAKVFGQTPRPPTVKIGKRLTNVAQVATLTPNVSSQTVQHYTVTINGTLYDFTSDSTPTAAEVVSGLIALVNADAASRVAATGTTTLILTASVAGRSFTCVPSANLTKVDTTANTGSAEGIAALSNNDNDWYCLIMTSKVADDIIEAAAYIEGVRKIYGVSKGDAAMIDAASTTDIGSVLKTANYFRTFVLYSGDSANFPEAALAGRVLPLTPGSETWAFKTLAGSAVDALTSTQINTLKNKNINYYTTLAGVSITRDGKTAAGEWIDVIRLIDLIEARMQEGVYGALVRNSKIPMTNGGISLVQSLIEGVLKANQKTGGIAPDNVDSLGNLVPGYTVSFPKVSDISANDKAARLLSGGVFTAVLAGAIHAANISGNVTV